MALPPTIPTSFVPRSSSGPRRFTADYSGAFGFFCYGVFVVVMVLSVGVFSYDRILKAQLNTAETSLAKAQQRINSETVRGYVQLRNRLESGKSLLENHVALSGFTGIINLDLPTTVRFTSMHLGVTDSKKVKFEASGNAASFNSLAALSKKMGDEGHVRDVVFSNIGIGLVKDSVKTNVSFGVTGVVDPPLAEFKATDLEEGATPPQTETP